jgi:hypothetical protein
MKYVTIYETVEHYNPERSNPVVYKFRFPLLDMEKYELK